MGWLNARRLRDYPRLIGISFWAVFVINILTHKGWFGGFGGIISFDFLTVYAVARLYWTDIQNLYNLDAQFEVERQVFWPTPLDGGGNVFPYPPYVAVPYSAFLSIPYIWAFIIWTALSIAAIVIANRVIHREMLTAQVKKAGLSSTQLQVLTFSFFPTLFGLFMGQNHALSLLFSVGVLVFTMKEKWVWAGMAAGLMLYKPHFCIAFVLVWLIWKKYAAVASFGVVAAVWGSSVLFTYGMEPYFLYLDAIPELLRLPYGISKYAEVTLFALIATLLPADYFEILQKFLQVLFILATIGLGGIAYWVRNQAQERKLPVLMLAMLYPFFVSPHTLNYDMLLLIPVLALWTQLPMPRAGLYWSIVVYLGSFLLLAITLPTGIALLALLPIGMSISIVRELVVMSRNQENLLTV
jgi:hypothetical protein